MDVSGLVAPGIAMKSDARRGRRGMALQCRVRTVVWGRQCLAVRAVALLCRVRSGFAGIAWNAVALKRAARRGSPKSNGPLRRAFSISSAYAAGAEATKAATTKQRNKQMSKSMSRAYLALRMKDAANCLATVAFKIAFLCFAFALAVVQTDIFADAILVSACFAVSATTLLLVAFLCDRSIRSLGFTEVELERQGLE